MKLSFGKLHYKPNILTTSDAIALGQIIFLAINQQSTDHEKKKFPANKILEKNLYVASSGSIQGTEYKTHLITKVKEG